MSSARLKRRVVLDTNVFVSSLFSRTGPPNAVVRACFGREVILVTSDEQRTELDDVLQRPRILGYAGLVLQDVENLRLLIDSAEFVQVVSIDIPVRDVKDQSILAAALNARVDFLVTGDEALLVLAGDPRIAPLRIVTPRAFLDELGREG